MSARYQARKVVEALGLPERTCAMELDLDAIFDYGHYTRHVPEVLARLEEVISPAT